MVCVGLMDLSIDSNIIIQTHNSLKRDSLAIKDKNIERLKKTVKIFQKSRFDKGFIEVEAEEPTKQGSEVNEGFILLRIGEQKEGPQNVFRLDINEARKLTTSINKFINKHDDKEIELINEVHDYGVFDPSFEQKNESPQTTENKDLDIFKMFGDQETRTQKKDQKPEYYY